jgi:REP element-mobilizing transposase RayT
VMDRGDQRKAIFRDDEDRERFLTTLGEACERTGWRLHAYVLMSNHYHFMLETPRDSANLRTRSSHERNSSLGIGADVSRKSV